jgi:hypothetical protein
MDERIDEDGVDDLSNPGASDLFAFHRQDKAVIDEIVLGLRELAAQPHLAPSRLRYLSFALLALQRFPRTTPGVELDVTLTYRFGDEMTYLGFYVGNSSFRLQTGGSVYTPGVGGDNFCDTVFEVGPSGFRQSDGWMALSGWIASFREHCRDREWNLGFDWIGDEAAIEWDEEFDVHHWRRLEGKDDE